MRFPSPRITIAFLVFAAILASLSGCSRQESKKGATAGPASGKTRLAFISNNSHQFWQFALRGTEKASADLGVDVEFKMPPLGNAEEQKRFIEDLLVKGVQGIAVSPNDSANMVGFFRDNVANRVPLLMVDNDLPDPKARRAYVGTHNYRAGRAAGELVVKAVPNGGKVAVFVGKMDAQNAVERRQGVLDVLAGIDSKELKEKTPADARNLKLGKYLLLDTRTDDTNQATCQERAEDLLSQHPDVAALVGLWEYNPPALLRAAEKMKSKTAIIGFDENDVTLIGIKEGKIVGTIVQSPFQFGYQSMKILASLAKKDDAILKNYDGDADNRIFIEHRIIDKDNVDGFHAEVKKVLGK